MEKEKGTDSWHKLSEEVLTGMREWRLQHAKAKLREIEEELDKRLSWMRARMVEDLALQSAAADWQDDAEKDKLVKPPVCAACGSKLIPRGRQVRILDTHGGETIKLERSYGVCPTCKGGVFPPG